MRACRLCSLLALAVLTVGAYQQRHADLNPLEINQLRDTALEPDQRLKLFVQFARVRMTALEQTLNDSKIAAADRPAQIHDRLQDFLGVYDEMNDNIDTYVDRKNDIRKPLKLIIEADTEFQAKMKAVQDAISKENTKPYEFVLSTLVETLNSSAEDHRKLLAEQEEIAKHSKKKKQEKP